MGYQLLQGDCIEVLKTLPAASVHCVVTSPPYFGLRDYGHEGQIGLEPTVQEYVQKLVDVFREVRRVLRDDGTVWLNLGDSYVNNPSTTEIPRIEQGNGSGVFRIPGEDHVQARRQEPNRATPLQHEGLKKKDLIGIPWRVAFALQADGWYLRSDIIWHKPNPMPESVTDRPTKAHEYVFLLAKSDRYYYDAEAIKEPAQFWEGQAATFERTGAVSEHILPGPTAAQHRQNRKPSGNYSAGAGRKDDGLHLSGGFPSGPTRNKRSVWTVATKPYREAHFATYPVELVEPCILAGTSAYGCCSVCGAPWVRVVERTAMEMKPGPSREACTENGKLRTQTNGTMTKPPTSTTLGWEPSCDCSADVTPCTVLDPFNGAGTTGVAAIGLGRQYIGIELNPDYLAMADRRLRSTQPALIAAD